MGHNFAFKFCAGALGLLIATWHQIPYADAVLIGLMAMNVSTAGLFASLQHRFKLGELGDDIKRKAIVFSPLFAIRMMEGLFPNTDATIDPDKWFATGLCAYELASIFETYGKATGRDIKPLAWLLERFGVKQAQPLTRQDQAPGSES